MFLPIVYYDFLFMFSKDSLKFLNKQKFNPSLDKVFHYCSIYILFKILNN